MIDDVTETRRTETSTLNTYLETVLTRALVAEKLLAEVRQGLLTHLKERPAAERKVPVDRTSAGGKIDNGTPKFQNSLLIKLPDPQVTQYTPTVDFVKIREKIKALDLQLQYKFNKYVVAEDARGQPEKDGAAMRDKLENDVGHDGRYSERAEARHTQALLATILVS